MATSCLLILGEAGNLVVHRDFRSDVPLDVARRACRTLFDGGDSLPPVWNHEGNSYVRMRFGPLLLISATNTNADAALALEFLAAIVSTMQSYFGKLNEESIRDNFVIIHELLDEMMDYGFPQFTEAGVLQKVITQESNRLDATLAQVRVAKEITGVQHWRPDGIFYKKNEVFLDVIERVNLLMNNDGRVVQSEVQGAVVMNIRLSGQPKLRLGLSEGVAFESHDASVVSRHARNQAASVTLQDLTFHKSVDTTEFERSRAICFTPPDGKFELMTYRCDATAKRPLIRVLAHIIKHDHSRVEMVIKARSQYSRRTSATKVRIIVPVPADADSPVFRSTTGRVTWAPERQAVVWTMKNLEGGKEPIMKAHFGLPSIRSAEPDESEARPIAIQFELPYFTVTGLRVRYLKIHEKSGYQALPWIRYITRSGDYQIRI